jgi:hypothetical protein
MRLPWSRRTVLAFGTPKFAGSNPAEAVRFFRAKKKILQHAFLERGSKITLKVALSRYFQAKCTGHFSPNSSTFHCWGRWRHADVQET